MIMGVTLECNRLRLDVFTLSQNEPNPATSRSQMGFEEQMAVGQPPGLLAS